MIVLAAKSVIYQQQKLPDDRFVLFPLLVNAKERIKFGQLIKYLTFCNFNIDLIENDEDSPANFKNAYGYMEYNTDDSNISKIKKELKETENINAINPFKTDFDKKGMLQIGNLYNISVSKSTIDFFKQELNDVDYCNYVIEIKDFKARETFSGYADNDYFVTFRFRVLKCIRNTISTFKREIFYDIFSKNLTENRDFYKDFRTSNYSLYVDCMSEEKEDILNRRDVAIQDMYKNVLEKEFKIRMVDRKGKTTAVYWESGDKTTVDIADNEKIYDPEKAILCAVAKKILKISGSPLSLNQYLKPFISYKKKK